MKLQQLMSPVRKAIDTYEMIDHGDRIAIGISGGKDSTALLYALNGLSKYYPKSFQIEAVTVDLGFGMDFSPISQICDSLEIRHSIINTQISQIVFDERTEKNPCSLCAKMRKGALTQTAARLGCNKIAYAHHKDDFIETMLLSIMFEGHFYCFPPVTHFEDNQIDVIRPMMYVNERDIIGFKNRYELPVIKNECPADGATKRQYVKDLVRQLNHDHKEIKEKMFSAIINGNISDWPHIN